MVSAERYGVRADTWEDLPPLPQESPDVHATSLAGRIFVCGLGISLYEFKCGEYVEIA